MIDRKIACFDVHYYQDHARACGIVFQTPPREKVISQYCVDVKSFYHYVPGQFYKRELPCILRVYHQIIEKISIIIVDGYVSLGDGKKGLGGHLYESLGEQIPVIGVAKTYFNGCADFTEVYRGKSCKPLYISSIGINLDFSAKLIGGLTGKYRIPDVLKEVDRLSKGIPG